jgi:hypothetical protein
MNLHDLLSFLRGLENKLHELPEYKEKTVSFYTPINGPHAEYYMCRLDEFFIAVNGKKAEIKMGLNAAGIYKLSYSLTLDVISFNGEINRIFLPPKEYPKEKHIRLRKVVLDYLKPVSVQFLKGLKP